MIIFRSIRSSSLTAIPVTIMMYRAQLGAVAPADVFIPILLATLMSTLTAICLVAIKQQINLYHRAILIPFVVILTLVAGLVFLFLPKERDLLDSHATAVANILLFSVICGFIIAGLRKKINVYDAFVEGAKEGFYTAIKIIPYLIAILVAIGVFRASGAMDYIIDGIKAGVTLFFLR